LLSFRYQKGIDKLFFFWDNGLTRKVLVKIKTVPLGRKEAKMANANLTVGSQFTTQKSGVVGTIEEVVENKTGSFRVRLDVNGQPRWTTVK
jgi:hypothetical protein